MGADIRGWVETRESVRAEWQAAIHITNIVHRQYGMFASLFGVRNGASGTPSAVGRFQAIAFGRGEPPEASYWYTQERYSGVAGETWVLWRELATINWEEEGAFYVGESASESDLVFTEPGPGRRRERRGDYLIGGWATLLKLMALLAEKFGDNNVRLCVWFNQW